MIGAEASLNCTKFRSGFRCVATDRDPVDKFKGMIVNTHSTDITLDLTNVVDLCGKIRTKSSGQNSTTQTEGMEPSSRPSTALTHRYDRGLRIQKNGSLKIEMERVKVPGYCSKAIIKHCKTSSGTRMDCSRLIQIK